VIVHFVDINGIVGTSLFKLSFPNLPSKYKKKKKKTLLKLLNFNAIFSN
jgi:hypothetical protein